MFATRVKLAPMLSKATRLQLGNIKTDYGLLSTAAGSAEKWGMLFGGKTYPIISLWGSVLFGVSILVIVGTYRDYRDLVVMTEHISYEDIKDRCLTPIPGWTRLRSGAMVNPAGIMTYRDPTPLDWLPFELKLGYVKQASY